MPARDKKPELCKLYNKGKECWRAATPRGCPYVHDFEIREEALNRVRLANHFKVLRDEAVGIPSAPRQPIEPEPEPLPYCPCKKWTCMKAHKPKKIAEKKAPNFKRQANNVSTEAWNQLAKHTAQSMAGDQAGQASTSCWKVYAERPRAKRRNFIQPKESFQSNGTEASILTEESSSKQDWATDVDSMESDDATIWIEVKGDGWGLSKVVVSEKIFCTTQFPSLSPSKVIPTSITTYSPGWTASKLDLSPPPIRVRLPPPHKKWELPPAPTGTPPPTWDWACEPWVERYVKSDTCKKYIIEKNSRGEIPISFFAEIQDKSPKDTSFPLFQAFPGEIRQLIWDKVLDSDRLEARIKFNYESGTGPPSYTGAKFTSHERAPRMLHINQESRFMAMNRFEKAFGVVQLDKETKIKHFQPGETYFNFKSDRLFIQSNVPAELTKITKHMDPRDMERVQWLMLPLHQYSLSYERDHKEFTDAINAFKGLKQLFFIIGDGDKDECYAQDKGLPKRIQDLVSKRWRAKHKSRPPGVFLKVVDALTARKLGLGGLFWG